MPKTCLPGYVPRTSAYGPLADIGKPDLTRTHQRLVALENRPNSGELFNYLFPDFPLGQQLVSLPVQKRPIDLYAALAEVAR